MTAIILTRHGHVDWIAPERFRGRADLSLTDLGVRQAQATGRRIAAIWRVAAVYTSPMRRCVRTGQIIAEPFGLDVEPTDGLNDIDYGEWQGMMPDEARESWPDEIELWYRRPDLARIPDGNRCRRCWRGRRAVCARSSTGTRATPWSWSATTASIASSCYTHSTWRSRATGI